MLETMATLILVIVGAVLIIAVLAYGLYITFFPLSKTVKGGIETQKRHDEGEGNKEVVEKPYARTPAEQIRPARKGGGSQDTQKRGHKAAQ